MSDAPNSEAVDRPLAQRLISPNGFDGMGPVPKLVTDACRRIAQLRTQFLTQRWPPILMASEVDDLFTAATIQAEWMRELFEARDTLIAQLSSVTEQRDRYERLEAAATKLHALHVKHDQMIDNDTWESEGALPVYKAIDNAEKRLAAALAAVQVSEPEDSEWTRTGEPIRMPEEPDAPQS